MTLNESSIQKALESVADVYGVGSIISQRRVEKITIRDGVVMLSLHLPVDDAQVKLRVEADSREEIKKLDGVREVIIMTKGAKPSLAARGPALSHTRMLRCARATAPGAGSCVRTLPAATFGSSRRASST